MINYIFLASKRSTICSRALCNAVCTGDHYELSRGTFLIHACTRELIQQQQKQLRPAVLSLRSRPAPSLEEGNQNTQWTLQQTGLRPDGKLMCVQCALLKFSSRLSTEELLKCPTKTIIYNNKKKNACKDGCTQVNPAFESKVALTRASDDCSGVYLLVINALLLQTVCVCVCVRVCACVMGDECKVCVSNDRNGEVGEI